ncbi:MAG: methionyl-tRNA formyltransferase, partial [Lachnospiraceae bacterium]|nr:methionyl-tRNA formyltransferase [Lachnospiraceae bacterium]
MKIVFMGPPDFAAGILDALLRAGYEVTGCVTQPDKPKGRKKTPVPCPVKEAAMAAGIPVLTPTRVRKNPEALAWIRERE